jgi:AcrR family transcriptional regulator
MGRWQPDARGRLVAAALDLYLERGFDQTTVADIAARAGVTERTFFRHFADKREALFDGAVVLQALVVDAVATAPAGSSPFEAATAGVLATAQVFDDREFSARRATAIEATPALMERELLKFAAMRDAVATALVARDADPLAAVAADAAVSVFHHGFQRWIHGGAVDYRAALEEALAAVRRIG